ncbi:SDR family oxidoreductase [Sphingomonas sp.]|uniref:SDR family NAD(P)-dependent oxidoreductase n=1 Tax=Sphingomonas sp. TaxID=28214 RepID=UPI0025F80197|nr:SDR family oxidoreductase [Sphingomonas sp.]
MTLPRTPSFGLDGRRAVVTGAGRGIGLALAAALGEAGAAVTLVARSGDEIAAGAVAIGNGAQALILDVDDFPSVARFFDERPGFDILINNAGTNRPKPMMDVSEADYDAVLDLNVKSAFFVAQGCVKAMLRDALRGSLIHVGSQMGHVGGPNRSLYCASKWALEGMSKAFALDLASYGIRSNTIAPTFVETPMTKPYFDDPAFKASVLEKIKLGRVGTVEDLMGAAVYLASDASALVTGTSLIVDGGWTAD